MKKYPISKYYVGIYVVGSIFVLLGLALGVYSVVQWVNWWLAWVMLLIPVFGILLIVCKFVFDFQSGNFSVDDSGITMRIAFKQWHHTWDAIQDCDIIGIPVADGEIFWVYFADRQLSNQEKGDFLRKTRKDLKHIAFFQYNHEITQEVLQRIPSSHADKLRCRVQQVEEEMTKIELIYHK